MFVCFLPETADLELDGHTGVKSAIRWPGRMHCMTIRSRRY